MCTIKHTCTQAQQNTPALVWNKICLNQSYNSVERGVRGQPPCIFSVSSSFALFRFLSPSLLCTRKTVTSVRDSKSSSPFLSKFRFAFREQETRTMVNHNRTVCFCLRISSQVALLELCFTRSMLSFCQSKHHCVYTRYPAEWLFHFVAWSCHFFIVMPELCDIFNGRSLLRLYRE